MLFFCPDVDMGTVEERADIDNRLMLKDINWPNTTFDFNGTTYSKKSVFQKTDGIRFGMYWNTASKIYQKIFVSNGNYYTIPAFASYIGITIQTNIDTAVSWKFDCQTLRQIDSCYWFTILCEDKLIFASPNNWSGSVQRKFNSVSSGMWDDSFSNIGFTGDTGKDFLIDRSGNIYHQTLTTAIKKLVTDKAKSQVYAVAVESNESANPMDYIMYNNQKYYIVSKNPIMQGLSTYIAVREIQ